LEQCNKAQLIVITEFLHLFVVRWHWYKPKLSWCKCLYFRCLLCDHDWVVFWRFLYVDYLETKSKLLRFLMVNYEAEIEAFW